MTEDEIKEIILHPRVGGEKAIALKMQRYSRLHCNGEGYFSWWLERMTQIESENSFNIKKLIAMPKTPRITEAIRKQYYKIFSAQGTVRDYKFKTDKRKELDEALNDVNHGLTLQDFMKTVWFESMFEEFNGFIGVNLKHEDELEDENTPEPYVELYPLSCIHDVRIKGNEIEYIVIHSIIKEEGKDIDLYRLVTEDRDTIYVKNGENISIRIVDGVPQDIENPFSCVPFIQVSQYHDSVLSNFLKKTVISSVITNLNNYQRLSDNHTVSLAIHGNPTLYSYPVVCPTCNGTKEVKRYADTDINHLEPENVECGGCYGKGMVAHWKSDTTQGISIPIGENADKDGYPNAPIPAGYIEFPSTALEQQRIELEEEEKQIEKGALGVEGILNRATGDQTATGQELDLAPLVDSLNGFAHNEETIEMFIIDRFGEVLFPNNFIESYVHRGRKYFLRSENAVVKEFEESKKGGANETYLRELLEELYYVRFENNPVQLTRSLILLDVEPFPTKNSFEELIGGVAPYTDRLKMVIKMNFSDYIERFELEQGKPITVFGQEMDYKKKINEIKLKLTEYAKEESTPEPAVEKQPGQNVPS